MVDGQVGLRVDGYGAGWLVVLARGTAHCCEWREDGRGGGRVRLGFVEWPMLG